MLSPQNKVIDLTQYDIVIVCDKNNNKLVNYLKTDIESFNKRVYLSNKILDTNKLQIITSYKFFKTLDKDIIDNYIIYNFDNQIYDIKQIYYLNAKLIIDNTRNNYNKLSQNIKNITKINLLPISSDIINDNNSEYDHDIIFIGQQSSRRQGVLAELQKKYKIKIVYNILDLEHAELINKTKIILILNENINDNINFAELNQLLSYNKLIICEKSIQYNPNETLLYKDDVLFIDHISDNILDQLTFNIDICLKNHSYYIENLNFIRQNTIQNLYNNYIYSLKTNLISLDLVDYKCVDIDVSKQIICLYHKEDEDRLNIFKKINVKFDENISYFDMIKNKNNNTELLLSYKILFNNFLKSNKNYLITCNINCILPQTLNKFINKVLNYMKSNNINIFVGNVDKFFDVEILKYDLVDMTKYTYFNNSHNINNIFNLFNIYSRNIVEEIINKDKNTNTNTNKNTNSTYQMNMITSDTQLFVNII